MDSRPSLPTLAIHLSLRPMVTTTTTTAVWVTTPASTRASTTLWTWATRARSPEGRGSGRIVQRTLTRETRTVREKERLCTWPQPNITPIPPSQVTRVSAQQWSSLPGRSLPRRGLGPGSRPRCRPSPAPGPGRPAESGLGMRRMTTWRLSWRISSGGTTRSLTRTMDKVRIRV